MTFGLSIARKRTCPHGEEGEILARGPGMFMGYADAEQTSEAITPDGYFRTGDLGVRSPEGAITITGRKKDLIIRGGENISAKEIEDVLHLHPTVKEASVVAMPHERLGEGVCAFIIARDEAPSAACWPIMSRSRPRQAENSRALRIRRRFPAHSRRQGPQGQFVQRSGRYSCAGQTVAAAPIIKQAPDNSPSLSHDACS